MFHPPVLRTTLALCLVSAALVGCGKNDNTVKAPLAVPVTLATVEARNMPDVMTAIGNVEPLASVAVKSRVDGQIVEVLIHDGQDVQRGQLMFQIDPRPFQLQIQQAEAVLSRDHALLDTATAQEARYRDLLAQKYISQDGYAQVKANMEVAAAALKSDESALANAKLQLEFARIHAPISGRLGKVELARGNLVKANDTNSLVVLNQVSPIYASFSVPEQTLARVRSAMKGGALPVHALGRDGSSVDEEGTLSFIDNAVDAGTGTIRLRAIFKNPKYTLWPGQFVNISLQLGEQRNALVVPSEAVLTGPKGTYVYVATPDGKAAMRDVKVSSDADHLSIISEGLGAGEKIVVDGQSRLTPGAMISTQAPAVSEAASTPAP